MSWHFPNHSFHLVSHQKGKSLQKLFFASQPSMTSLGSEWKNLPTPLEQKCTHIVNPEEAERHNMSAPFGPGSTGAAAGGDAATVEHDRHIVGTL